MTPSTPSQRPSLIEMSAGARLVLAGLALALVWGAVFWALGTTP
jgi:hypothetical protein